MPIEPGLEQIRFLGIDCRAGAATRAIRRIAPQSVVASCASGAGVADPATRRPISIGQHVVFLLRNRELVLLHRLLALQQRHALAMPLGVFPRDRRRFAVADIVRQLAPPQRSRQVLLLGREFTDGTTQGVGHILETDLEIDQCVVEDACLTSTQATQPLLVQQAVEPGFELIESHNGVKCYRPMVSLGTMRPLALAAPITLLLLAGCNLSERATRCGIAALAGPTMLLEEFTHPGKTMGAVTVAMPEVLPVRFAAGAAQRGLVGQTDSTWIVGVDGPFPPVAEKSFGVLLVDPVAGPRGVLLYEGPPIRGAPILGSVHVSDRVLPMIGLNTTVAAFEDSNCPLFPDSLRQ